MPFVRCKFYTESGEPSRGGCQKKGCAFIHPGDSDWINAPPPSFRAREKSGDSGGPKSWGGKRGAPPTSETSGNAGGSGWGTGASTSTPSWGPDLTGPKNQSATSSWGTNDGWGTSWGNYKESSNDAESAWGSARNNGWGTSWGNDKNTRSAWGSAQNDGREASWGNDKEGSKDTESAGGSTQNDGWETSWGNGKEGSKDAGSAWGNTQNDGWGTSWGNYKDADRDAGSAWGSTQNKDATNSREAPESMIVDSLAEKEVERKKGKSRVTLAPPRIRIPDTGNKKAKISGSNDELPSAEKWGEPRSSNLVAPATALAVDPIDVKGKLDAAHDDKLNVFKDYAKIWERGIRARFLLNEAQVQRGRWFHTQKSVCYARIGEAGRKRLDGQRAEYDKEVNLQKEKLSSAITSLVEFHDTFSSNLDLDQRYNIGKEAESFIAESKAFVDEVRAILVARILGDKGDVQSGEIQKHTSRTDATFVDSLRSQVRDLEERFDQAQTELTLRHRHDIRSEIDERLASKISALRVARQQEIDCVAPQRRAEIVIPPHAIENEGTAEQVRELDAKVPRLVEDIRVLLLRVDATTKRVSELEEQLSANKAAYTKVQNMAAEKKEIEQRMNQRLEKIQQQFEKLVTPQPAGHAAQPIVSPTINSSRDKLMENLQPAFEAVLEQFYEQEVRPSIESLQRAVVEASGRHQEEAIKVLWGKMQPAMNMVAGVSQWLDSQELKLTAPIEDHTYIAGYGP